MNIHILYSQIFSENKDLKDQIEKMKGEKEFDLKLISELRKSLQIKEHRIKILESLLEEASYKGIGIRKVEINCKCGGNCSCSS